MPEYVRIPQWLLEAMYRESSRIMSCAVIPTSSLSFIEVCTSAGLLLHEKISSYFHSVLSNVFRGTRKVWILESIESGGEEASTSSRV